MYKQYAELNDNERFQVDEEYDIRVEDRDLYVYEVTEWGGVFLHKAPRPEGLQVNIQYHYLTKEEPELHIFKREIRPESHVYRLGKRIVREIEFAMILDGELQGYARSYLDAELTLNSIVYERLTSAVPTLEEAAAARAEIDDMRLAA